MKFVDIGLMHFDETSQMEVFIKVLNDDGTVTARKFSDLFRENTEALEQARLRLASYE